MSQGKYDQYFVSNNIVKTNKWGGEGISLLAAVPPEILPATARFILSVTATRSPYMFHDTVHKHMFTEYFVYFGSNPLNMKDFDADIAMSYGPEKEKHIIKSPALIVAPPGLYHCPLEYARVGKPFFGVEAFMVAKRTAVDLGEDTEEIRLQEENYNRFFIDGVVRDNQFGGETISLSQIPEFIFPANAKFILNVHAVKKPYTMFKNTHKHAFTEYLFFMGSNPLNMKEFGAEIEMYMGTEKEKHVINTPTIVVVPPGTYHCPIEITKIDKPFFLMESYITSKYSQSELAP